MFGTGEQGPLFDPTTRGEDCSAAAAGCSVDSQIVQKKIDE